LEFVAPALSVTCTVNADVPAVAGVPLSTPAVLKARPGGKVPPVIAHVYGRVPPLAAYVSEYTEFVRPPGNGGAVVMLRTVPTTILKFLINDCDGKPLSVTLYANR